MLKVTKTSSFYRVEDEETNEHSYGDTLQEAYENFFLDLIEEDEIFDLVNMMFSNDKLQFNLYWQEMKDILDLFEHWIEYYWRNKKMIWARLRWKLRDYKRRLLRKFGWETY